MAQVKTGSFAKNKNERMCSFESLVKEAKNNDKYMLRSKKDVMHLPLFIALGETVAKGYEDFYEKYITLLENKNVEKDVITTVKNTLPWPTKGS